MRRTKDILDRLWARVDKTDTCWVWTGCLDRKGYGIIGGKQDDAKVSFRVHRLAYAQANGRIADGAQVDHTCHNRACVRPDHLRSTTHKQNQENRPGASTTSKTGVRGVYLDKARNKWAAGVRHNGRTVHAGRFDSLAEAEAAAIAKRKELFTHNDADRLAA